MPSPLRLALYGEINMNLIDGSSVWLQSVAQMLTTIPWVEVTVLLRAPEKREVLTAPLRDHSRIELVDPADLGREGALDSAAALDALEALDAERRFDLVLVRGAAVSQEACRRATFAGRLWAYYLPLHKPRPGGELEHVRLLSSACERILCQTEPIRALVEAAAPEQASKLILLPPMIPAAASSGSAEDRSGPLKLVYAGKFAPEYHFLEMVETFGRLRRAEPDAELHLVGDKVHNPPDDPGFKPAAEAALAETEGVIWHGGVGREQVTSLLDEANVALSVRHPMMARSREISTKVLEYGAAGCAVLLNRTPLYEELLGPDYPLFVDDSGDALVALLRAGEDRGLLEEAADRCRAAAQAFTFERIAAQLEPYLRQQRVEAKAARAGADPRSRLLIAGHDLKFLAQIPARARAAGAEIREDVWEGHNKHSEKASTALLAWADTVMCEWCLGNAIWYSHNVREDQRLVIRYHRMERETDYPAAVDIDQVDCVVFVGRHLLEEAVQRNSWPEEKVRVVPNAIDPRELRRTKLAGSEFNLGLIGWVPARKRLDRALDILELLRAQDPRFRLLAKGQPPWAHPWVLRREEERRYYEQIYRRIRTSPLLGEAVSFEGFGQIPAFLRKIGVILSTSDHEGHQVAPAEAMASGCVPVVIDRPGARDQYTDRWVHDTPQEAASSVLELVAGSRLEVEGEDAAEYAERWSVEAVMPLWDAVLGLRSPEAAEAGAAAAG